MTAQPNDGTGNPTTLKFIGEGEDGVVDSLTLRFVGEEEDGSELHELRAAHVAEVLQGLVGIAGDFTRAGAFGPEALGTEVLVKPAREGSFIIEVVRYAQDNAALAAAAAAGAGMPSLGKIIFWATKSARAEVEQFDHLPNGNVKVVWQDSTAEEVPLDAWNELQKRQPRRKKQLREIMAPLSDSRVTEVQVSDEDPEVVEAAEVEPAFVLTRPDLDAIQIEDEVEETSTIFETEAQMSAVDFDNADKWRVRTKEANRSATVEDTEFLNRISAGLPIRKSDIFNLKIREDLVVKNGRSNRTWTVLEVISFRRGAHDDDDT